MTNNQQPGWPQQPNNQQPQPEGTPPIPPAPGQGGQPPQFPPYAQQQWPQQGQPRFSQQQGQQGQPPYGNPGEQYGQGTTFMKAPPKKGLPVWGWVASGVGVVGVIIVAGVMVFNGLPGSNKPDAVPDVKTSESVAPEELADAGATESAAGAIYLFDDAGFTGAPVWSIREPQGWTKEPVKEGMVHYRNSSLQCTFTTYQATIEPTGGTDDEAATGLVMASEIEAVKGSVGKPVQVIDDAGSRYVNLRDGSQEIEMQEAELRFKNDSDADVVYLMAVRATSSTNGLMELALACPAGTSEEVWLELTDRVSMVDPA
ncbi:hypothetical protein [Pseudarthrobacter sulfonivorans]|uniref:hypothetical protein n=1 Tax=Pseudarthrobacter sulfonivorans TaxID=121292 RepID=UPI002862FCFF|nr:hypothetical protein [Pseudarthrobacter sulfonivorans]MDR6413328.1 hypothetical protein [Pseudarthrobacter sulfonivorans]